MKNRTTVTDNDLLCGLVVALLLAMVTIAFFAVASSGGVKPNPEPEVIHDACLGTGLPAHPEQLVDGSQR